MYLLQPFMKMECFLIYQLFEPVTKIIYTKMHANNMYQKNYNCTVLFIVIVIVVIILFVI